MAQRGRPRKEVKEDKADDIVVGDIPNSHTEDGLKVKRIGDMEKDPVGLDG